MQYYFNLKLSEITNITLNLGNIKKIEDSFGISYYSVALNNKPNMDNIKDYT